MSFSSLCGIHTSTYFSRMNLNTSCSCHSVSSLCPPQLTGRSATALAPPQRHDITLKTEPDKKVLSDLSYSPVLSSNEWIFVALLNPNVECALLILSHGRILVTQQRTSNLQGSCKKTPITSIYLWYEETPETAQANSLHCHKYPHGWKQNKENLGHSWSFTTPPREHVAAPICAESRLWDQESHYGFVRPQCCSSCRGQFGRGDTPGLLSGAGSWSQSKSTCWDRRSRLTLLRNHHAAQICLLLGFVLAW